MPRFAMVILTLLLSTGLSQGAAELLACLKSEMVLFAFCSISFGEDPNAG